MERCPVNACYLERKEKLKQFSAPGGKSLADAVGSCQPSLAACRRFWLGMILVNMEFGQDGFWPSRINLRMRLGGIPDEL